MFLRMVLVVFFTALVFGNQKERKVLVTAHRGFSGKTPENTLIAMKKAIEIGADYAELDVQETADGVLILLHDGTLKRTANLNWNIWETTYDSLQDVDVGSWFNSEFRGEPVPTLKQIVDNVREKMKLNIELKMNGHEKMLTEKVVELIENENFIQHCIITSFNFEAINKVRKLNNNVKVGYIFSKMPGEDVFIADVDLLSVNKKLVDKSFVEKAHANKKEVHVWTVNEPKEMHRLIDLGVDNIITNYPDTLLSLMNN